MSTLGAGDLGHRVVVRRRLTGDPEGYRFTDVIGALHSVSDTTVAVRRADASVVSVHRADVTAARVVPPLPLRRVDRETLPLVTALGRPAAETVLIGDWRLRASGGWTRRANSLLGHGDPRTDLDTALAGVAEFYRTRGLPPLALVVLGSGFESTLRDRGWGEAEPNQPDSLLLHTTLDLVNAEPSWPVTVSDRPDEEWYAAAFGGAAPPEVARVVLEGAPVAGFASIRVAGRVAAAGRGSVTGHWVGLDSIRVADGHRRRGLGTALVRALARWGGALGGRRTYLEVFERNTVAVTAYRDLGFTEAYRYRYLTPAPVGRDGG